MYARSKILYVHLIPWTLQSGSEQYVFCKHIFMNRTGEVIYGWRIPRQAWRADSCSDKPPPLRMRRPTLYIIMVFRLVYISLE